MADTTDKALNLCSRLMAEAENLMRALEEFAALATEQSSTNLDLTGEAMDTALESSSMKHATGEDFLAVITSANAVRAFVTDQFHATNFNKVRP
jgi:hypothetical protein